MLGVSIIHSLKAAGYTRLPHFHPVWGEVYRGQDTRRLQSERVRTLDGSVTACRSTRTGGGLPPCAPPIPVLQDTKLTSTCGHAVGGHGWASHGFEAVFSIVGTHVALQSLGCGP